MTKSLNVNIKREQMYLEKINIISSLIFEMLQIFFFWGGRESLKANLIMWFFPHIDTMQAFCSLLYSEYSARLNVPLSLLIHSIVWMAGKENTKQQWLSPSDFSSASESNCHPKQDLIFGSKFHLKNL